MKMKKKNVHTGINGEKYIMFLLEKQGFSVSYPDGNFSGDLIAHDPIHNRTSKVEVKTSKRNADGTFNFCLYREGKTDCRHADVVALVFVDKKAVYVRFVDTLAICGVKCLRITKLPQDYKGKYAKHFETHLSSVFLW